ncbi:hypothetical protein ACTJK3_27295, partial [Pseudomonas sp. 22105]
RDATGKTSYSNPLEFVVGTAADDKPQITSAKGFQSNEEIREGETTVETSATFEGSAAKGQRVEVFDGTTPKGQSTADLVTGIWTLTITDMSLTGHSFSAKALYGSGQSSTPRTFNVTAVIDPTITRVNENTATGAAVAIGGSTIAPTLVISGKLSLGQQGELWDGSGASAKSLGKVAADAKGDYSKTVTAAPGAHRFYIQSLYHPGKPVYSIPHTLTVVAVVVPTIDKVNENTATGAAVAIGGSTIASTLVISGKLSPGQQGELWDGSGASAKSLGTVTADAKGDCSKTVTAALGAHRFYIQSLYHPGKPVYSIPHTLTVVAVVVPTIDKVNENTATGALVANAGFATATTLVISGKLSPGQQGELWDGSGASAKSLGKVTADAKGDYSKTVTAAQGAHRFVVESLYHSSQTYSKEYTLTVVTLVSGQENFESESLQLFKLNRKVSFRSGMQFVWLSGYGTIPYLFLPIQDLYSHWGRVALAMFGRNEHRFELPGTTKTIKFDYYAPLGGSITFYDAIGVVETKQAPKTNVSAPFIYTAIAGRFITHFEIVNPMNSGGDFLIDNIYWS